jgi:hypothetical protein
VLTSSSACVHITTGGGSGYRASPRQRRARSNRTHAARPCSRGRSVDAGSAGCSRGCAGVQTIVANSSLVPLFETTLCLRVGVTCDVLCVRRGQQINIFPSLYTLPSLLIRSSLIQLTCFSSHAACRGTSSSLSYNPFTLLTRSLYPLTTIFTRSVSIARCVQRDQQQARLERVDSRRRQDQETSAAREHAHAAKMRAIAARDEERTRKANEVR